MRASHRTKDQSVELAIGNLLRTGVVCSAAVVLCGAIVYLARNGASAADYHVFRGEPADLRSVTGIIEDALSLRGRGIIQLGLLMLIGTPVARVVFSIWGFAAERDPLYVVVATIVLVILLYSLLGGAAS